MRRQIVSVCNAVSYNTNCQASSNLQWYECCHLTWFTIRSISIISRMTSAVVSSLGIIADGIGTALVGIYGTFVNVYKNSLLSIYGYINQRKNTRNSWLVPTPENKNTEDSGWKWPHTSISQFRIRSTTSWTWYLKCQMIHLFYLFISMPIQIDYTKTDVKTVKNIRTVERVETALKVWNFKASGYLGTWNRL